MQLVGECLPFLAKKNKDLSDFAPLRNAFSYPVEIGPALSLPMICSSTSRTAMTARNDQPNIAIAYIAATNRLDQLTN